MMNGICWGYAIALIATGIVISLTDSSVWVTILVFLAMAFCFLLLIRYQLIMYIQKVGKLLDEVMEKGSFDDQKLLFRDELFSKLLQKMWKISTAQKEISESVKHEKKQLQGVISDIAHQIKTPMTNVILYHEILERSLFGNSECLETLDVVKSQISKLEFLLNSIIQTSEMETGLIRLYKERVTLSECLKKALETAVLKAEKKGITIKALDKADEETYCDIRWTAEALFNILDNAVKYSPENTEIEISSGRSGIYSFLRIKDHGIGIDLNNISKIYKRFYRENEDTKVEGLGLGLYLSREIIMRQDGYILVDSQKGKGSEFSVFLPRNESVGGANESGLQDCRSGQRN